MAVRFPLSALVVGVLLVGACDGGVAALPARDHSADQASLPMQVASLETSADPRDAPVPAFKGRPMWSANRDRTAEENARAAYERNGEAFGAASLEDFVAKAHAFTGNPPRGSETLTRASNGDKLIYDPAGNVFAVVTRDGAPRTMFKPDNGAAYWEEQKAREAQRAG